MRAALLACLVAACVDRAPAMPDAAVDAGAIKVACDGALCATDNGGTCSAGSADPMWLVGALVAIAATRRRRQR